MNNAEREKRVAALQRERVGLVARGLDDRVRQVDDQIREYGGEVPKAEPKPAKSDDSEPGTAPKDERKQPPKNRSTRPATETG